MKSLHFVKQNTSNLPSTGRTCASYSTELLCRVYIASILIGFHSPLKTD